MKRQVLIIVLLIGVLFGTICLLQKWTNPFAKDDMGTIEGSISVYKDKEAIDSSQIFLECVEETSLKPCKIQKGIEENQIKYSISTEEKDFYKVTLKIPCDSIGLAEESSEWIQYDIFIFNLAGDNTVQADIDINIQEKDNLYESCCTVTVLRNEKEILEKKSILNEQKNIELRIGP